MTDVNIDDLSAIKPEQFSYGLLDQIFWKHQGKGSGTLVIGGIKVTKYVRGPYSSNSGKSRDFEVQFTFIDAAGKAQEFIKESNYGSNRRNDSERNWGLPE